MLNKVSWPKYLCVYREMEGRGLSGRKSNNRQGFRSMAGWWLQSKTCTGFRWFLYKTFWEGRNPSLVSLYLQDESLDLELKLY